MINLKKNFFFFKLDKYRKLIRYISLVNFYKNKIFLICQLVFFSGFSIKLLKDLICSTIYSSNNFDFDFLITSKNQNYFYNYKINKEIINKKSIVFFFNTFNDIYLFLYRSKVLMLSPYIYFPLIFYSPLKKVILPFNLFYCYFKEYKYKYYNNSFLYYIYLNIIKKTIIIIFIFIFLKITIK